MNTQSQGLGSFSPREDRTIPPAIGLMMAGSVSLLLWVGIAGLVSFL